MSSTGKVLYDLITLDALISSGLWTRSSVKTKPMLLYAVVLAVLPDNPCLRR